MRKRRRKKETCGIVFQSERNGGERRGREKSMLLHVYLYYPSAFFTGVSLTRMKTRGLINLKLGPMKLSMSSRLRLVIFTRDS